MGIFATRLKELRATQSQAAFASAIGVNRVQYAKYESGQNTPSIEFLANVCRAMPGVSADWLLGLCDSATLRETNITTGNNSAVAIGANARATSRTTNYQLPTTNTPGEMPACSKCPHLKKLKKLEAMIVK